MRLGTGRMTLDARVVWGAILGLTVVGTVVITVPWQLFALTATAAIGLATATSMVTAVTGTRRSATSLTTGR